MICIVLFNLCCIAVMFFDKKRAVSGGYRIPENTLFVLALLGGSLGIWIGMYLFRHKTQKVRFVLGLPIIIAIQTALILFL